MRSQISISFGRFRKLTIASNVAPNTKKNDKNEQTEHISAGPFRQWTFEILIVFQRFTCGITSNEHSRSMIRQRSVCKTQQNYIDNYALVAVEIRGVQFFCRHLKNSNPWQLLLNSRQIKNEINKNEKKITLQNFLAHLKNTFPGGIVTKTHY